MNSAPLNSLVPRFVIELTTAPLARPNSASNWFVITWNSSTDSRATRVCPPAEVPELSSLLAEPSTCTLLVLGCCPLAMIESLPRLDEGRNWIPGSRATAEK